MARAISEDRKSVTRRIIKPQPPTDTVGGFVTTATSRLAAGFVPARPELGADFDSFIRSRYAPGDRMYVKEAWAPLDSEFHPSPSGRNVIYRADHRDPKGDGRDRIKWRSPLFMPEWAARLKIGITSVRVERLQDITEADAQAEGMLFVPREPPFPCWQYEPGGEHFPTARDAFAALWDSINGKTFPWGVNPWVHVVEFRRVA